MREIIKATSGCISGVNTTLCRVKAVQRSSYSAENTGFFFFLHAWQTTVNLKHEMQKLCFFCSQGVRTSLWQGGCKDHPLLNVRCRNHLLVQARNTDLPVFQAEQSTILFRRQSGDHSLLQTGSEETHPLLQKVQDPILGQKLENKEPFQAGSEQCRGPAVLNPTGHLFRCQSVTVGRRGEKGMEGKEVG